MVKTKQKKDLRKKVKDLKSQIHNNVIFGSGFGPDIFVSEKKLKQWHNAIKKELGEYEKKPNQETLAKLHDAVMAFEIETTGSSVGDNIHHQLMERFKKTKKFQEIKKFWEKQDINKVYMDFEEAMELAALTMKRTKRGSVELSGGMRAEKTEKGVVLKTDYAHTLATRNWAPDFLLPLVKSKSNITWHTHPFPRGRASLSDIYHAKTTKIPAITVEMHRGIPKLYITLKGKMAEIHLTNVPPFIKYRLERGLPLF